MHEGTWVQEYLILQPQRMPLAHPFGEALVGPAPYPRLHERAIEAEIDFGQTRDRSELLVILLVVAAHGPDIIQGPGFEPHEIVAPQQIGGLGLDILWHHHRFIKAGWEHVDEVNVARELGMLLLGNRAGDEDAEVTS